MLHIWEFLDIKTLGTLITFSNQAIAMHSYNMVTEDN